MWESEWTRSAIGRRRLTRRRVAAVGAAAAGAWAAAQVAPPGAAAAATRPVPSAERAIGGGKTSDELRIALASIPPGMDPLIDQSNASVRVFGLLFDTLLRRDWAHGGRLAPGLAAEWTRVDDTTVELVLREDVVWHDGTPFTAQDVTYTFGLIRSGDPKIGSSIAGFFPFASVEALDDRRVRIVTDGVDAPLELRLAYHYAVIVPAAYHARVGFDAFATEPVGTGPYRLTAFVQDDRGAFAANERSVGGPPAARAVTVRAIPEVATRIAALLNDEVDLIQDVPPDQIPTLEERDDLVVKSTPMPFFLFLAPNALLAPLDRKEVRQALDLAIDRKALVEQLFGGYAFWSRGVQFEGDPLYNPERPQWPYDPGRARALLEQGGYAGEEISYLFVSPNYYVLERETAEAVIGMWREIGVNATLHGLELSQKREAFDTTPSEYHVTTISDNGELDILLQKWGPDYWAQRFWPGGHFAQLDRLREQARRTLAADARAAIYQQALDIVQDEVMVIGLVGLTNVAAMKEWVEWTPDPNHPIDLRPERFRVR